ncbi:MAG: ankyrin repeat domain-containing protein [Planctomycetales bacterium]|nr:ankyrin repeat domain-containing protein [Planctomycetales bacterium]
MKRSRFPVGRIKALRSSGIRVTLASCRNCEDLFRPTFRCVIACLGTIAMCLSLAVADELDGLTSMLATELSDAAEQQQWDRLQKMLQGDVDTGQAQVDGMTALHWAAYWKHEDAVRWLLDKQCSVNSQTEYEITPLSIACENGSPRIVRMLLAAGADAKQVLPGGETVLMTAARTGVADSVAALIEAGADVNATERRKQTALMWAAAEGNVEAVDLLLNAGADPNASIRSGFTAMLFAAREGRIDCAKRLLAAGVDVNAVMHPASTAGRAPRDGMSALMLAVESGHFELAVELVEAGADPNDQRSGYGPLHALTWVRKTKIGDSVDGDPPPRGSGQVTDMQFVREMVRLGADVNLQLKKGSGGRAKLNHRGATPFLLASSTADLALMQLLVELGADPTLTNVDHCPPLLAAAGIGVTAVGEEPGTEEEVAAAIQYLLELGADLNVVDDNGETAMHGAAYRTYPATVALLGELGADKNVWNRKNKYGWTPTMIAQGKRPGSFKPSPETIVAIERLLE